MNFLVNNALMLMKGSDSCIDGGMTKQMNYHGDNRWLLQNEEDSYGK